MIRLLLPSSKTLILLLMLMSFARIANGQGAQHMDSLWNLYNDKSAPDSHRLRAINLVSWRMMFTDKDSADYLLKLNIGLAQELKNQMFIGYAFNSYAVFYTIQNDYSNALDYYYKSLKIAESMDNKKGMGAAYNNIGNIYSYQGNEIKAIEYYLKSGDYDMMIHDTSAFVNSLSNAATSYIKLRNYREAIKLYRESYQIAILDEDRFDALIGISNWYLDMASEPIDSIVKAMDIDTAEAIKLNKIGLDSATNFMKMATTYEDKIPVNKQEVLYRNLGDLEHRLGNYKKALDYLHRAKKLDDRSGRATNLKHVHYLFYSIYKKMEEPELALEHFEEHFKLYKEVRREESKDEAIQKELEHEYEKQKAVSDKEHEKQMLLAAEAEQRQLIISIAIGLGLLMAIAFGVIIFNRLKITREQKDIISEKNEELNQLIEEIEAQRDQIESQNSELSKKNDDILSSIQYAKRIQEAILPSDELIGKTLPESFVIYKPKDIVSGDFYWLEDFDSKVYWATVDCTGHGVPGAFMSLLGSNGLKKVLHEDSARKPADILTQLTNHVISSIQETRQGEEVKDGMDISLCCWDKKTNILEWAGAYNPLWLIRAEAVHGLPEKHKFVPFDEADATKGGLYDITATKRPIGRFKSKNPPEFVNHKIQIQKGDALYVFTDGFQDQFGGSDGRKFGAKNLKKLLMEIYDQNMPSQKEHLNKVFDEWKRGREQLDDVCLFGVRV